MPNGKHFLMAYLYDEVRTFYNPLPEDHGFSRGSLLKIPARYCPPPAAAGRKTHQLADEKSFPQTPSIFRPLAEIPLVRKHAGGKI
jgi:hypothetical protein